MKRSTKFALAAVAALGVAAVAVPVVAQQGQVQHDGMMGGSMGMMGQHGGMMGGGQSYAMATFDTNKDGTLSPEEMTAGIQAELKTYDTDANGKLSLEEFAVMHAAHTRPMTVRARSAGKRRAVSCMSDGNTGAQPRPMSTAASATCQALLARTMAQAVASVNVATTPSSSAVRE